MTGQPRRDRSITEVERPWLDCWSLETQALLIGLVRERRSNAVASGVAGWLSVKKANLVDVTGPRQRSEYRKVLAELASEGLSPDPARAPVSLAAARARRLRTQGGMAAAAMALALSLPGVQARSGGSSEAAAHPGPCAENVWQLRQDEDEDEDDRNTHARQGVVLWRHVSETCSDRWATRPQHVQAA